MKFFKYIVSAIVFVPLSLMAGGASDVNVSELGKYVYPNNRPASPQKMVYQPDGLAYFVLGADGKSIVKHDTKTGNVVETVLDVAKTRETKIESISDFSLSPDGTKMLVYQNRKPIYRHSFNADYYVFEISRNILRPLSKTFEMQQAPLFSPDGRMVAFVAENNIYVKKLDYQTELAVTTDGKVNEIINGVPDWTYQEEFSTTSSMVWAPDNLTLCYIKYNEKDVPTFSFPIYQGTCNPNDEYAYYPGQFAYKYPVAGMKNSVVSVHSYDVETRKTKKIAFADENIEYIPRIAYACKPERLIVTTLNRAQTRMEMYTVNPKSTVAKSLYVEEAKAWISPNVYEKVKYYPEYFMILSERSGYSHVYKYGYSGNLMKQITSGNYDVTDYYGCTERGTHYIQSTVSGAVNRVVSSIDVKGNRVDLSAKEGMASASFSPTMGNYVLNYSNVNTPPRYALYDSRNKELRVLEDNAGYKMKFGGIPSKEFFQMTSDGVTLNGYMLKPSNFNASQRYPVIMSQYSGPGSQEVLNRWRMDWDYYFVEQGYIVVSVDGRGTGGRGRAFQDVVYKRLGYYETIDQIAAANYVASLPYIDKNKIGIYGWSYGGYETLMAVSQKNSPYAAAVAIAPVTDWRYYDTVYAERYMLTPQENEDGYNAGAPIRLTENMNCRLLLMSGTADDNVHFTNTLQYVSVLQSQGKLCDMFIFPNMNHSINGCNARAVVYAKMLDYFNRNLK